MLVKAVPYGMFNYYQKVMCNMFKNICKIYRKYFSTNYITDIKLKLTINLFEICRKSGMIGKNSINKGC